jgi:hypothetical protein
MTWVATAVIGSAVVGAGTSAYGANKAANAQESAANQANQLSREAQIQARADQAPWRQAGGASLNRLSILLGLDPKMSGVMPTLENSSDIRARLAPTYRSLKLAPTDYTSRLNLAVRAEQQKQRDALAEYKKNPVTNNVTHPEFGSLMDDFTLADFEKDPGYEFRLAEGMRGLENSATARGGLLSGAALKAAARFSQDFASNEFGNAWNRDSINKTNKFNRLASLAGVGQTAATQMGNTSLQTAQTIGNNTTGAGNARASGYVGTANAINNGISQGMNWWQGNQLINKLGSGGDWWTTPAGINANGGGF